MKNHPRKYFWNPLTTQISNLSLKMGHFCWENSVLAHFDRKHQVRGKLFRGFLLRVFKHGFMQDGFTMSPTSPMQNNFEFGWGPKFAIWCWKILFPPKNINFRAHFIINFQWNEHLVIRSCWSWGMWYSHTWSHEKWCKGVVFQNFSFHPLTQVVKKSVLGV